VIPTLAGAQITFNGIAAPILSTPGSTQLNVQIPVELAGAPSATVQVTVNGQTSASSTLSLAPLSPGLIAANATGSGQGAILNDKDANQGVQSFVAASAFAPKAHPAAPGDIIEIYGTGLGAVTPTVATGMRPQGLPQTVTKPVVTIGGVPATVTFSGLASCCVGLNQVNVQVPAGTPTGDAVTVVLSMGSIQANPVTIAVSSSATTISLQGTAASVSTTLLATQLLGSGATGSLTLSLTGVSSGGQTVYTGGGTGSGTAPCSNGSTGNWAITIAGTITVSPAVTSLATSGGTVSGTLNASFSGSYCGTTQPATPGTGTVTGTVRPGGAVTLILGAS
jgi:uncharacterized protein (TIGR03437 family)